MAGQKAFSLLSSNALRVFAINSVGDFVLWLGKAFVVAITVFVGLELIQVSGKLTPLSRPSNAPLDSDT